MTFNNKVYDTLKWIAQYLLPAAGALYFALAKIWGFPFGTEVVGTISAVDAFIGALLGISSHNYQGDGTIYISPTDPENGKSEIEFNDYVDAIGTDKIVLNVKHLEE